MTQPRTCVICEKEFVLRPGKPGFANQCEFCSESTEEPEPVMAEVFWENKHTPVIEITTAAKARAFNAKTARRGFFPNLKFSSQAPSQKQGSGAESGASYTDRLGQKHSVK